MGGGQGLVCRFVSLIFFFPVSLLSPRSSPHPAQPVALKLGHLFGGGFRRAGDTGVSWHSNCCSGTKGGFFFAATVTAASQNSKSARLGTNPASLRVAEGWYVGG